MKGWIDFFVLMFKDIKAEYWEFDHKGWNSPPESARFQIRVDRRGSLILMGLTDPDTGETMWIPDDEPWISFEEAAYHCIDRYFAQDCIVNRYNDGEDDDPALDPRNDPARADDYEPNNEPVRRGPEIDMSPGDGDDISALGGSPMSVLTVHEWMEAFSGRPVED
jgi:hypothetical protein